MGWLAEWYVLMERGECNERIRINPSISETHYCVNYTVTEQTSEDKKILFPRKYVMYDLE